MYVEGELLMDVKREMENESYPCDACNGTGYHDVYISEYDIEEIICTKCDGLGVLKGYYENE